MKKFRKLIPALALLLVSAVLMSTASYAWFSMNTKVTVTGMKVTTKVGSNVMIAATNTEESYTLGLDQTKTGLLEPVSTIDAVTYYYTATTNVSADGKAVSAAYTSYTPGDAFDINYGVNDTTSEADALGYIDYSFYLKATNADASAKKLVMSTCNITYAGSAISDKAWRVALFVKSTATATDVTDATAAVEANLITILKPSGAAYFDGTAVSGADAKATVSTKIDDAATVDASVASGATVYYKVVVRLWLEGEDTNCKNDTYAALTKDFRLDLAFQLQADDGVTVLGSVGSAVATASTNKATVTLSDTTSGTIANGETASTFQWYDATTNTPIVSATAYQYTNNGGSAVSVYCLVTTARGSVYRTNTVDLAANA